MLRETTCQASPCRLAKATRTASPAIARTMPTPWVTLLAISSRRSDGKGCEALRDAAQEAGMDSLCRGRAVLLGSVTESSNADALRGGDELQGSRQTGNAGSDSHASAGQRAGGPQQQMRQEQLRTEQISGSTKTADVVFQQGPRHPQRHYRPADVQGSACVRQTSPRCGEFPRHATGGHGVRWREYRWGT